MPEAQTLVPSRALPQRNGSRWRSFLSDEKQYLALLARLVDSRADLLLEGHFGIFETKQEVRQFVEYCRSPSPPSCRC
jgi:hypothetical protein